MNIVFDLGGVVFTWQPDKIIQRVFRDKETQEKVKAEIFSHPDWLDLDRGILHRSEAIERAVMRTRLPKTRITELMQQIPLSLTPIEETIKLVHSVKEKGHQVFVLSNIHLASIEYIEGKYSFWDVFDGKVISCRIHMVKPEAKIYEYLLTKYELDARETIFIDDTEINLIAAKRQGIKPVLFENPQQCEIELRRIGCI